MTVRVRPGSPPLDTEEPETDDVLSDSEWEGLDEPEDQTVVNLRKIAQAKRNKNAG